MGTVSETIIGLGMDLVFLTFVYYWYKRSNRSADEIKNSKTLKIDETLEGTVRSAKDSFIPFACVIGEATPVGSTLHSRHVEGQSGVIQRIRLEEHKAHYWSNDVNAVKVIQDIIQSVPFTLQRVCSNKKPADVLVVDTESANYIIKDLTLTHDAFQPVNAGGFFSRLVDRLSNDLVKGYHESEKMLLNNTTLLAIGELRYVDGKIQIAPPRSGAEYILTKKSLPDIIQLAEKKSLWMKCLLIGTATIWVALSGKHMYDVYQRRKEEYERIRNYAEMRRLMAEAQSRGSLTALNTDGDNEDRNTCVVCLSNPRQIVLLDCGHICLCADCVMQLHLPTSCPVCRQPVVRYIPTYNP